MQGAISINILCKSTMYLVQQYILDSLLHIQSRYFTLQFTAYNIIGQFKSLWLWPCMNINYHPAIFCNKVISQFNPSSDIHSSYSPQWSRSFVPRIQRINCTPQQILSPLFFFDVESNELSYKHRVKHVSVEDRSKSLKI